MEAKEKGAALRTDSPSTGNVFSVAKVVKKPILEMFATKNFGYSLDKLLKQLDAIAEMNQSNCVILSMCKSDENDMPEETANQELEEIKASIMADVKMVEARASQPHGKKIGGLVAYQANDYAALAAREPDALPLFKELWFEGQIAILFARDGVGKSIFALQVAVEIARRKKVIYFDYEMSFADFKDRYVANDGTPYNFPPNLTYVTPNYDNIANVEALSDIEQCTRDIGAEVLIIDNITALSCELEEGSEAIKLMQKIKKMAMANHWSVMLIAHTPKLAEGCQIRQTDVAGSKKITDLAPSVFSIGKSLKNEPLRYLVQFKQRHSHTEFYDQSNILLLRLNKVYNFLSFVEVGTSTEVEELNITSPRGGQQSRKSGVEDMVRTILADGKEMGQNELGKAISNAMEGEKGWSLTNAKTYIREEVKKGGLIALNSNGKYCLRSSGQVV